MGKISQLPNNTNPSLNDSVIGIQASSTTDQKFILNNLPINSGNGYNPYKFSAFATTYNAPASAHTVQFNSELFDTNNNFNTSTYTYTAPVAGFYQFMAGVNSGVNPNIGYSTLLAKNGVEVLRGNAYISTYSNSSFSVTTVSGLLQLAAGDNITVTWLGQAGTGNYTIVGGSNLTYFQGFYVSV